MTKDLKPLRADPLELDQPSPSRRKLLKACAWLPASPLLAMLVGCNSGGDEATVEDTASSISTTSTGSTFDPAAGDAVPGLKIDLPPYSKNQDTTLPTLKLEETGPFETVTIIDPPPPAPGESVEETHTFRLGSTEKVGIYNMEYNSFTQVSARKTVPSGTRNSIVIPGLAAGTAYEGIKDYVERSLKNRFALMYRAMVAAFEKHPPKEYFVSFFTAPEFYWNVPWGDFINEREVQAIADIYLDTVTNYANALIKKFPLEKYGRIILLPGTVAALKLDPTISRPAGTTSDSKGIYEAFNQLTCTHNLPLVEDGKNVRPAYMVWPKRVVSWIDFINDGSTPCKYSVETLDPKVSNPSLTSSAERCVLSKKAGDLTVLISYVTSPMATSYDQNGKILSENFQNDILDEVPFGIDICLDYMAASVQKNKYRIAQLTESKFKLDFVIAAGISLNTNNYVSTPHIQYAIHNDGILGSSESSRRGSLPLYSTIWKLAYEQKTADTWKVMNDMLAPLGANDPYDNKNGIIAVNNTGTYEPPAGTDMEGIPDIEDAMNASHVRVWSVKVDIADRLDPSIEIIPDQQDVAGDDGGVHIIK